MTRIAIDPRLGEPALAAYRLARESRLQKVESRIARDRLAEVLVGLDSAEAHALSVAINAMADVEDASRRWDDEIAPALGRLDVAVASGDHAAVTGVVKDIASALRLRLDFEHDSSIIEALADEFVPMRMGGHSKVSSGPPRDRVIERLGQPVEPPDGIPSEAVGAVLASRRKLLVREDSGIQILR